MKSEFPPNLKFRMKPLKSPVIQSIKKRQDNFGKKKKYFCKTYENEK